MDRVKEWISETGLIILTGLLIGGFVAYVAFFAPRVDAATPQVQTYTNCAPRTVAVAVSNITDADQRFHVRAVIASKYSPLVQYTRTRNAVVEPGQTKVFNFHPRKTFYQTGINVKADGVMLFDGSLTAPNC